MKKKRIFKNKLFDIKELSILLKENMTDIKYRSLMANYRRKYKVGLKNFFANYSVSKKIFWTQDIKIIDNYVEKVQEYDQFFKKKSQFELKMIVRILKNINVE